MVDVAIVCEGDTEREFCKSVISPYLCARNVALWGTLVGRTGRKRGGIRDWDVYRRELVRHAKERDDRQVGVLVDFYAMPASWPGRSEATTMPAVERGEYVEKALIADLNEELQGRFVPCVQLHEFETLLFVAPEVTARSLSMRATDKSAAVLNRRLVQVVQECGGVEQIDDNPATAPSKRLVKIVNRYDKVAWGVSAVSEVGLDVLRDGCPWLNRWLTSLEALGEA